MDSQKNLFWMYKPQIQVTQAYNRNRGMFLRINFILVVRTVKPSISTQSLIKILEFHLGGLIGASGKSLI
jgi:hypothetical protein